MPGPVTETATPVVPPMPAELPTEPATTSTGLPNPYGLPEIAVERPEVGVGAAFAGGLVLALILKRFAR
jgi:hypothetical protein